MMYNMSYLLHFITFSILMVTVGQSSSQLPEYSFQLSVEGTSPAFSSQVNEKLFFIDKNLTLFCRLYEIGSPDIEGSANTLMARVDASQSPYFIVRNSSWYASFHFEEGSQNMWNLTLTREQFTISGSYIAATVKEEWEVEVTMEFEGQNVSKFSSLLDLGTEPILQWLLGVPVSFTDVNCTSTSKMIISNSPCALDVKLFTCNTSEPQTALYIGITSSAFAPDSVEWFKLETTDICNDCTRIQILDMVLTNHHLVLLTSHGVFVSQDLRTANSATPVRELLNFTATLKRQIGDLVEGHLDYTQNCLSRQHDIFRGDIIGAIFTSDTGVKELLMTYDPFVVWRSANKTGDDVLSSVYALHTHTLVQLGNTQSNTASINVLKLLENGGYGSYSFPTWHFPGTSSLNRLVTIPWSQQIVAIGNQVWISEDGGNYFTPILTLNSTFITDIVFDYYGHNLVVTTADGHIYVGKPGISRMVKLETTLVDERIIMDHIGKLYLITITNSGAINRTEIDMKEELKKSDLAVAHPLAIQFITDQDIYLFEYEGTDQNSAFSQHNIGQAVYGKSGGVALVTGISFKRLLPGYLAKLQVQIVNKFRFEDRTTSPAQLSSLSIKFQDTSGTAILELADNSWKSSDESKCVVVPGHSSFILLEKQTNTQMRAQAAMLFGSDVVISSGHWFVVDLGLDILGKPTWQLLEPECIHEIKLDSLLKQQRLFELDVQERLEATVTVETSDPRSYEVEPMLYVTFSAPWQFKFKHKTKLMRHPPRHQVQIIMVNHIVRKGVTAVRFHTPAASLLCSRPVFNINVIAGCPYGKCLKFQYPVDIPLEDFLHGNPTSSEGRSLLHSLEPNYRPPSKLGLHVPISENIYNADPTKPIIRMKFRISKRTGKMKQCAGKSDKIECGCTDEMKFSADSKFTNCRERVYRLIHPGKLYPSLLVQQPGRLDKLLANNYVVTIEELNSRAPAIHRKGILPVLLKELEKDSRFQGSSYYSPNGIEITMNGSELYHYRAQLINGFSHCDLYVDFQVYVDRAPIAYPLQYILNFFTIIVIGGFLFVVYLWYLSNHHKHRVRQTGPRCPDHHEVQALRERMAS